MRLKAMIGICAVAIVAICVVGASSAFAEVKREPAGAPEFGRCVKVAKGESGGYANAGCTTKETGGKYEWYPGPGEKSKFTAEGREIDTSEATRCLRWQTEIDNSEPKRAEELLEGWKYTAAQCEKAVKASRCYEWLRKGGPAPPWLVGYTKIIDPTSAECEAPAKEWEEDYLKEQVLLETENGYKVECEKVSATGEYSPSNEKLTEHVFATFTNCVGTIGSASAKCSSAGAAEGEIVTSELTGELGVIKAEVGHPEDDQVGISLAPTSGETVAQTECGPVLGSYVKVTVTGSVIHPVNTNKMVLEETEKFSQKKGRQDPEEFQGEPQDVLTTTIGAFRPEQSGEVLLATLVNEEKIEVNSAV